MAATSAQPVLPVSVFDCHFHADRPDRLPAYAGSAWRGAFGRALKKTVCVIRGTACPSCLLYRTCVYPYVFETPPPPDSAKMRRYTAAPHPFILNIDPQSDGAPYRLGLVLFGRSDRYLPYFVHALGQAGTAGLGKNRERFELTEVFQAVDAGTDEWESIYAPDRPLAVKPGRTPEIPPIPDRFELCLETPLRLRREDHLVTPNGFRFADLFGSLLRRISMLTYFHTDTPLEADFAGLVRASRAVPVHDPELGWYDWTRYSSRQDTTLEMGGLLGRFTLHGSDVAPFWSYLWLGQWTHAGKGTVMGLGRYRILAARLPRAP